MYGVGAVLYFLLTGKPPHDGETLKDVLEQASDAPIIPPRQVNRGVPRALDRICMKAPASDPQALPVGRCTSPRLAAVSHHAHADPVLVAVAVLLSLLVPAWGFWPNWSGRDRQHRAETADRVLTQPRLETTRLPETNLSVRGSRYLIFSTGTTRAISRGSWDRSRSRPTSKRRDRAGRAVRAGLLVSDRLRPDGTDELCDPDDENARPARKQQPRYPAAARQERPAIPLERGSGSMPSYWWCARHCRRIESGRERIGPAAWDAKPPLEAGVVWRDDGSGLQPLRADDASGTRGTGAKVRGASDPVAKLVTWLCALPRHRCRDRPGLSRRGRRQDHDGEMPR